MLYVPFSKILSILYVSKAMVDYLIKQNQIFDIIIIMDDIDMTASIRPRPFSRGNCSHHKYMKNLGLNNLKRAGSKNAGKKKNS